MQPNGRLDKPLASGSHTNWAYVVLTDDFNWFVGLEKSFFLIYYKRRRTGARKKERKKDAQCQLCMTSESSGADVDPSALRIKC